MAPWKRLPNARAALVHPSTGEKENGAVRAELPKMAESSGERLRANHRPREGRKVVVSPLEDGAEDKEPDTG